MLGHQPHHRITSKTYYKMSLTLIIQYQNSMICIMQEGTLYTFKTCISCFCHITHNAYFSELCFKVLGLFCTCVHIYLNLLHSWFKTNYYFWSASTVHVRVFSLWIMLFLRYNAYDAVYGNVTRTVFMASDDSTVFSEAERKYGYYLLF